MPIWGWVCSGLAVAFIIFVIYANVADAKKKRYTLEHGTATHGWLVQANQALFESGNMDLPALVIISPDEETNDDEEFMSELADRIMELKGEDGDTKDERKVARLMADETYLTGRWDELPAGFTDGKTVYLVHIMIYRDHLPGKKIDERKILCSIVWDEPGTVVCTRPEERRSRKKQRRSFDEE